MDPTSHNEALPDTTGREIAPGQLPDWSSPGRILLVTTISIGLAELVAMVIIYQLPGLPYAVQTLIDAAMMVVLIFPVLYFLSFRQLLYHIRRHEEYELRLQSANKELQSLSLAERKQRRWAEALAEATAALNKSLDLDEVLTQILGHIGRVIPCQAAAIMLLEGETVTVLRHRGFEPLPEALEAYERQGFDWGPFPSLIQARETGEAVLVSDVESSVLRTGVSGFEWVRSFMIAPLRYSNQLEGLIVLLSNETNFFSPADLERLISFSNYAEVAIGNARLFESESQARELADVLYAASTALAESLDLDVVAQRSLDFIARLVAFDRADVVLWDNSDRLIILATKQRDATETPPQLPAEYIRAGDFPLIKALLQDQQHKSVADTKRFAGWRHFTDENHVRSWLGVPLNAGTRPIGFYSLEKFVPDFFTESDVRMATALATQTAVTIQKAWLFEQVRTGSERLQALSRRLVEVQESERNYISRELHDETGQALAALSVDLHVLEQNSHRPDVIRDRVARMDRTLKDTSSNLHRLAMALRPAALDHVGLEAALQQYIEEMSERHNLAIHFVSSDLGGNLPNSVETILYRIVQEALTNTVRHAQATQVDILVKRRAEQVALVVEDNGVGFDPLEDLGGEHLGLVGMRERAEMLGGELTVESEPGKGTTIVVEVPCGYPDADC